MLAQIISLDRRRLAVAWVENLHKASHVVDDDLLAIGLCEANESESSAERARMKARANLQRELDLPSTVASGAGSTNTPLQKEQTKHDFLSELTGQSEV